MRPHQGEPHDDVRFHRLSDRVVVVLAPVTGERVLANATIVLGDRRTAVIDTMISAAMAAPVRSEAERLGGRPVGVVVLTHADPDHVLGAAAFPGAVVVAAQRTAAVLADPAVQRSYAAIHERLGDAAEPFLAPVVDVAFPDAATVDLGGVTLTASHVGPAHSPGDTLLWSPQERIGWSGDLVFHGVFPLVRDEVDRWFAGLERLASWRPAQVVPGHGLVADAGVIEAQRRVLRAVLEEVEGFHRAGVPVAEAVARSSVPESCRRLPLALERWPGTVRGVYAALDRRGGQARTMAEGAVGGACGVKAM